MLDEVKEQYGVPFGRVNKTGPSKATSKKEMLVFDWCR